MFGPVFTAEMLTTSRRARYILLRAGYASLLLFVLWIVYRQTMWSASYGRPSIEQMAALAAGFFHGFCFVQLAVVLLCGPAMVAATIAQERERRTLEYLFATDLTNREIVLGKFVARFLQIAMLVAVGLPILALVMMLGGIPPLFLLQLFLITVSTAAWVTALSILISVYTPSPRLAVVRTYLTLFALLAGPWLVYWFLFLAAGIMTGFSGQTGLEQYFPWLVGATSYNPLVFYLQLVNPFGLMSWSNWTPLALALGEQFLMICVSLVLACWAVRRVHLKAQGKGAHGGELPSGTLKIIPAGASTTSEGEEPSTATVASTPQLILYRRPVGDHPMRWKELYTSQPRGILIRIAKFLAVLFTLLFSVGIAWQALSSSYVSQLDYTGPMAGWTAFIFSFWLLLVGAQSSGGISGERDRDTWLTLISTTITPQEILQGKLAGSLRSLPRLWILIVVLWLPGVFITHRSPLLYLGEVLIPLLTLSVFAVSVAMIGLTCSLVSKSSTRALGSTLAILFTLGGGYLFCCLPMMMNIFPRDLEQLVLAPCIPYALGVAWVGTTSTSYDPEWVTMLAISLTFYLSLAVVLYVYCLRNFSQLAGRSFSTSQRNVQLREAVRTPAESPLIPTSATASTEVSPVANMTQNPETDSAGS